MGGNTEGLLTTAEVLREAETVTARSRDHREGRAPTATRGLTEVKTNQGLLSGAPELRH